MKDKFDDLRVLLLMTSRKKPEYIYDIRREMLQPINKQVGVLPLTQRTSTLLLETTVATTNSPENNRFGANIDEQTPLQKSTASMIHNDPINSGKPHSFTI